MIGDRVWIDFGAIVLTEVAIEERSGVGVSALVAKDFDSNVIV